MTRRRFYVPRDAIQNGIAHLPEDQSHHLRNVLRIDEGGIVEVFDGAGGAFTGEVVFGDSEVKVCDLQPLLSPKSQIPLILAAALIKPSKFEWMLQKVTELGIHEIYPVMTGRSGPRMPRDKIDRRLQRWGRITMEASKQCGRFFSPEVHSPLYFEDLLYKETLSGFSKFIFYENAEKIWRPDMLDTAPNSIVICIGPEGGWEEREVEQASAAGFRVSSLGSSILRAETAAISAVSIIQYHISIQVKNESKD